MDYGNVFSRAWRICWNNKYLFVLGFLAALGAGSSGGAPNFNYSFSEGQAPPIAPENFDRILALIGPIVGALICLGLILAIVMWLIRLAAQAGLISSVARHDRGESSSLGESLSAGLSRLWQFLGLNLLVYLPFWIVGAVFFGIGIFAFGAAVASALAGTGGEELGAMSGGFALLGLCVVALTCLLIPLFAVASVVYAFAQRAIVLQDMSVMQSVGHAWRFVRDNVGDVLLLIIFLVVISVLYSALVSIILIPLGFLALGPAVIDLISGVQLQAIDVAFAIGGAIILGIIGALLNAIFIAFRSASVTLAYQDLLGKPVEKTVEPAL